MSTNDEGLRSLFIDESKTSVKEIELCLDELREYPENKELFAIISKAAHSLEGNSLLAGEHQIAYFASKINRMAKDGEVDFLPEFFSSLKEAVEAAAKTKAGKQTGETIRLQKTLQRLEKSERDRSRVRTELKSSEERLRILFESAPDAIYLSDMKGNFIDGNKASEELTGYKKSDLIGKNFLKVGLLSPEQIPKAIKLLAKNALGKPTGPDEFTLNRKNRTGVVTEIRTFPVKIENENLVLGIARDINERKKAEEKIANLAKFPSENPNPVLRISKEGKVLYANKGALSLLMESSIRTEETLPRKWKGLVRNVFKSNKKAVIDYEVKEKTYSFTFSPIREAGYVNAYGLDITERKKAEEKLIKQKEKYEKEIKELKRRLKKR